MNVAVVGASNKPDRYSYKAILSLKENGHRPLPIHPRLSEIEGVPVYPSLEAVDEPIDTITMYLAKRNSDQIADQIVNAGARRVIFNPGAENDELKQRLENAGAEVLEACTLVLLSTGQF